MKNILYIRLYFSPLLWRPVRRYALVLLLAGGASGGEVFAQQTKIDSLVMLLKTDKEDTHKVKHLHKLCIEHQNIGDFKTALSDEQQMLSLSQKLNWNKGKARAYNSIGIIYRNQGNYPESLKSHFAGLKMYEELKDKWGIASSYGNIGNVYLQQGNYPEALKNQFADLKIAEEIGDKKLMSSSYGNVGIIYEKQGNYSEALKNHFASLKLKKEIGDMEGISDSYTNIGIIYDYQGNYPEAFKNYFASVKINEEIGDKDGISTCFINLGTLYTKLNKIKEAQKYLDKALRLSIEIGSKDAIKETYGGLAYLDSTTGNFKAAFAHHKLYIIYRDSLDNEETQKKSLQAGMQYEFDKKEIATKAEQDKLNAISGEEKQKQQIVIYAVAGVLLLVIVFSLFLLNRFRITNRQKVIIEKQKQRVDRAYESLHEKNKEVMDSINYASRIQRALLPSVKYIENGLKKLNTIDRR